jgi:O-acetylhomoserine/O-acetylserine sulfhydrylase-like pyridoxal-dependent enzyme
MNMHHERLASMRKLSPRRNTSQASDLDSLVVEQLRHFDLDPASDFGRALSAAARNIYETQADVDQLWRISLETIGKLDAPERISRFNAKKFLSFQLAKVLDTLQNPFRSSYQSLRLTTGTQIAKGPYPIFDNITAIFSATPVITRTATYVYACAEWIEDAFAGKELMLEIYSRLLNPTSVSLANYIVDLEAGPHADQYLAWNFSSGMAAIDGVLSHLLGRDDILICSRNIYGGAHQLIHDWFAKPGNLEIGVETFNGYGVRDFEACWKSVREKYASRLESGRRAYVYLESPCNPHGYVLDVPNICRRAHEIGLRVILDATVATPFLCRPLQRTNVMERPDFLIHSYTKDLSGTGGAIAGCVIGRNEDMFLPKGTVTGDHRWDQTMFWNVYYVKGAFLNADAAFEVIQGIRTLDVRMLRKCINTQILAQFFDAHPEIQVNSHALPDNENYELKQRILHQGLPAPLFTMDIHGIERATFQRFFDSLSPVFEHMISLGQSNTIVSCPSLTTHSELDAAALEDSGLSPTTIRCSVGDEDPFDLMTHFVNTAKAAIDPDVPGFSKKFPNRRQMGDLSQAIYSRIHASFMQGRVAEFLESHE